MINFQHIIIAYKHVSACSKSSDPSISRIFDNVLLKLRSLILDCVLDDEFISFLNNFSHN